MKEMGPERKKIRVMVRTLHKKREFAENLSGESKSLRFGVGEAGSDWHDTQALHGDIYVNQAVMKAIGLPEGEIEIITPREKVEEIGIGNTITLKDSEGKPFKITIGGEYDFDPSEGIFSCNSPIAKAALGRKKGDVFEIGSSDDEETFEVIDISRGEF